MATEAQTTALPVQLLLKRGSHLLDQWQALLGRQQLYVSKTGGSLGPWAAARSPEAKHRAQDTNGANPEPAREGGAALPLLLSEVPGHIGEKGPDGVSIGPSSPKVACKAF